MIRIKPTEKSMVGWYFLVAVLLAYAAGFFINTIAIIKSIEFFWTIIQNIIPILVMVFGLLVVINYFIKPEVLLKFLGKEAGMKGWLVSIIGGIISTGPIYMWYPLLNDLQKHGARNRYIATFLYNRAVKIPLLPLFIYYFGVLYVAVLTIVMIATSVLQGVVVEKLMEVGK